MAVLSPSSPVLRVVQNNGDHFPQIFDGEENDLTSYLRKVDIHMEPNDVTTAVIEVFKPSFDVMAVLKESRIVYVCSECQNRSEEPL